MDYRDIGYVSKGTLDPGKLKIQVDGFFFKSGKTGKSLQVKESNISNLQWLRAARGYEVKVITRDGDIIKFDGFRESDYGELKDFFRSQFHQELREVELCVKGWNWGEAHFQGSLLSFKIDSKPAFEIPLKEVSQVTSGKNEVTLEFHQSEDAPVSLVEMRFHIPNIEGEDDPVKEFREKALAQADIIQAIGDAIATFPEIQSLTPRGRYNVKAYPKFLQLHGKTFDYKIPYPTITRLFLLPHNDQRQMFFVLGLDPPIRQGQTRYHFVIQLLPIDEELEITLACSNEELESRYGGKLKREMSGALYEVFSRVLRVLVGKKITVPGSFKTNNNQCAIQCSTKATSGFLYPLDKGFIFVHKPAVYIKFDGIASVNFARMTGGAGVSRSFDFELEMKDGNVYHFGSLMKEDYTRLFEFVTEKHIRIKNKGGKVETVVTYNDEDSSEEDYDPYLERMKAEGEERDSEDEDSDYVAKGSGSDDHFEYDSDAQLSGGESGGEGGGAGSGGEGGGAGSGAGSEEEHRAKKRKASGSQAKPKAKRKKEETKPGGRKKRATAAKDPNAPKKPMSVYMLWLQDNRSAIQKSNPGLSMIEIGKKAGELWRELGEGEKAKYAEKSTKLKQQYEIDLAEYKASGMAAEFAASGSKTPTKAAAKSKTKKSPSKPPKAKAVSSSKGDSKKYKSAEFIIDSDEEDQSSRKGKTGKSAASSSSRRSADSDEDLSSDEEEREASSSKNGKSAAAPSRTSRSARKGGGELVSLPSNDEGSESDAEVTGGESESSEEESD